MSFSLVEQRFLLRSYKYGATFIQNKSIRQAHALPLLLRRTGFNGEYHFGRAGVSLAVCANPEFLSKFDDARVGLSAAERTTFWVCAGCCKSTRRALEKSEAGTPPYFKL